MNVLAFAASSSRTSINKRLVRYAASLIKGAEINVLDLNDYELPLFSEDREKEMDQPELAKDFLAEIANADALIISFAEHNGSYSAAYKNLFDWCSRITKVFQGKSMVMLSTSPGARGGATVLSTAVKSASHFNGDVKASLSIPSFYDNFDLENNRLSNPELNKALQDTVNALS
jgi:NAD(P)H-dependent FMN reductase